VLLYVWADFLLAAAGFYLSFLILFDGRNPTQAAEAATLTWRMLLFALFVSGGIGATGLYGHQQRYQIEGILARLIVGLCFAATGLALLDFIFDYIEWRGLWVLAVGLSGGLLAVSRVLLHRLLREEAFQRRVLVYGAGNRASRILELRRRSDQRGFRIVAFWPAAGDELVIDDNRVLHEPGESLLDFVDNERIDEIVVALDDRRRNLPIEELLECKLRGIKVIDLLGFLERETGRVKVDMVNPSWLVFSEGFNRLSGSSIAFRLLDVVVSLVFFIIALPLSALVALAIVIDDGFPVLYKQRRVGVNGVEFQLFKFRSMRTDAESAGKAVWAQTDDARVTRVGRIIRKLRLDELPQLFNVLRGDMSFVGPRPERPEFVEQLTQSIPYYQQRHYVKPGITGWAQLCYPYGSSEKDALSKLEYDIYYVKHRSLIFNIVILIQTAEVILWQKGSR